MTRPALLAICALAALVQLAGVIDATGLNGTPPWQGWWGANTGASSTPFHIAITSVDPNGPAARAGLRRGDLIDIRANSLLDRYSIFDVPLNGRRLSLLVHRGSLEKTFTVVPIPLKLAWNFWLGTFVALWLLLFAGLIAWRRADVAQMRLLSLWLALFVLTGALLDFAAPWAWVYVLVNICVSIAAPLSVALLTAFASAFAQPLSRSRRVAQWLCYSFLFIFTMISLTGIVGIVTLRFDPLPFVVGAGGLVFISAAVLMAVLCGVLAIAASRGVERQRALWTLVPLATFFCFFIVAVVATSSPSYADSILIGLISTLVLLAAPVALTYAVLSRRLIDIGFFLNRAAVFAIVSAIVLGVFVSVEFVAGEWLVTTGHSASTLIGMSLALALGLSMRFIHKYVDRFVDRVLFRKRHENEAALLRFAHESSFITDRITLVERAVRTVKEHTNAVEATILVRSGAAYISATITDPPTIASENDPAIVALRAWHKQVDLQSVADSNLRGEFALPMFSRGTLVGILVCGEKRNSEVYAPDEISALLALAHGVGTTLDVLSTQREQPDEAMRRELAELREDVNRLLLH